MASIPPRPLREILRGLRLRAALTPEEVAARIGRGRATVFAYESAADTGYPPDPVVLDALLVLYGAHVHERVEALEALPVAHREHAQRTSDSREAV